MAAIAAEGLPIRSPRLGLVARLRGNDRLVHLVVGAFGLLVLCITVMLAWELWSNTVLPRQRFGWGFLLRQVWDPVADEFGAAAFIYGTLVTSLTALLLAVPCGVGVAIFLAELAPRRVSDLTALLVELLAAVPSVIYGLVGVSILIPLMRTWVQPVLRSLTGGFFLFSGPAYGVGFLTAGLV